MARAKVIHSVDACEIAFKGDIRNPEPATGVITFPGGHVEVSRTSNGNYWAHLYMEKPENVAESRIDYDYEGYTATNGNIPDMPHAEHIQHIAFLVKRGGMNRITTMQLERQVSLINELTNSPQEQWEKHSPMHLASVPGNYHLDSGYGKYKLARNLKSGGEANVLNIGFVSKRDLYDLMGAYICGLRDAKGEL